MKLYIVPLLHINGKNLARTTNISPGTANFEVVVSSSEPEPEPEASSSEECVTLNYSIEDEAANLYDEMAASQSLLLLSESGEGRKGKEISCCP